MPFVIALAIMAPLAFLLAHFPQSPDGAEMVSVALNGGVLHPSGMPLQAWINRAVVAIFPNSPGYALSWVSWVGGVLTVWVLIEILRRLGVRTRESILAALVYAYVPIVAFMTVIPEKYSWLSFTQLLFISFLIRLHALKSPRRRDWILLGVSLALALSQHSANVILVPVFGYFTLRHFWLNRKVRRLAFFDVVSSWASAALVTLAFYASLLLMRSRNPWPDWGQLENFEDVYHHAIRTDYGVTQLFNQDMQGERVSAFLLLAKGMASWNLAFLFVLLGLFALTYTKPGRFVWGLLLMILLPGLAVLTKTAMPAADLGTAMGYQERYPLLVWPLLAIFWGVGASWLLQRMPKWDKWISAVVAIFVAISAYQGFSAQTYADNNLTEIYREQADFEMDDFTIFWTASDFTGFYGVPRKSGVVFPLKNLIGMPWYREKVLPAMSPALTRILNEARPENSVELFRQAIREGFKIVLTEPTAFLADQNIMAQAEQTGVLWNFSAANTAVYTKQLIANTLHLCTRLGDVRKGLPVEGMYFLREYLSSFRYAFMSAADFLQLQNESSASQAARDVSSILEPGRNPQEWRAACEKYQAAMRVQPN